MVEEAKPSLEVTTTETRTMNGFKCDRCGALVKPLSTVYSVRVVTRHDEWDQAPATRGRFRRSRAATTHHRVCSETCAHAVEVEAELTERAP